MTRTQSVVLAILAAAVLVVFCAVGFAAVSTLQSLTARPEALTPIPVAFAPATPTPANTPTPTQTPTPAPTATWVLAWPSPRPATPDAPRTRVPGPLQDAWDKNAQARVMRFDIEMTVKGNLGNLPGAGQNSQNLPFFSLAGEANGKDIHFTLKGILLALLGADAARGVEMISIGDKAYVRGPLPMLGAPEAKWYVGSPDKVNLAIGSSASSTQMVDAFKGENPDWTAFIKTGTETLDGKRCDVYTADEAAAGRLLASLGAAAAADAYSPADLITAQARAWVCNDGYLHQLHVGMTGGVKERPDQKMAIEMRLHFYDLNGNIRITAPAGAVPLLAPSFQMTPPASGLVPLVTPP